MEGTLTIPPRHLSLAILEQEIRNHERVRRELHSQLIPNFLQTPRSKYMLYPYFAALYGTSAACMWAMGRLVLVSAFCVDMGIFIGPKRWADSFGGRDTRLGGERVRGVGFHHCGG